MIGELETGLSLYYNEVQENPNLDKNDQVMYLANLCFVYWVDADLISMPSTPSNHLPSIEGGLMVNPPLTVLKNI
jgi:hypothetical protein